MTFLGLNAVDWTGIAAIATVVLALEGGTLLVQWRARWDARAEQARTDEARRENQLHRHRFTELYRWWHDKPDGPERISAMDWFAEWTGSRPPYHGSDDGAQTPGLHSASAGDAYRDYVTFLAEQYQPSSRLGRPRPPL